jgi:two-component system NarL family sensor kinase
VAQLRPDLSWRAGHARNGADPIRLVSRSSPEETTPGTRKPDAARPRRIRGGTTPDCRESQQIAETVQESIRSLRSLVIDLYPPNLREEGLASALRDLVERARDNGLNAELDTSSLHDPLPDAVAGLLYRSAQEGLRNALQHADATSITVRVRTANGNVVLEVVDDGRGFDDATLAAREADGHVGLKALRGLVGDGGGSLRVRSTPGSNAVEDRGTTMTVEIPLP